MENKVALITGASSGLGSELAIVLAKKKYNLALIARRIDLLDDLVKDIEKEGGKAIAVKADVVENDEIIKAVKYTETTLGPIDLIVANAGISYNSRIELFDAKKARQVYEINVIGLMQTIAAALPFFIKRNKGHIVGIASLASYINVPSTSVYCSSKVAVRSFLDGIRNDLAKTDIAVSTICPGFVRTPILKDFRRKFPFELTTQQAVKQIVEAIESKKRIYNFPKVLYYIIKLFNLIPSSIQTPVLTSLLSRKKK
jgi:short-subunit dehydrogenase